MNNKCVIVFNNVSRYIVYKIKGIYYKMTSKHSTVLVQNIFEKQYDGDNCNRLDTVVRYLAIEEYYGKNEVGFQLYEKMQKQRLERNNVDDCIERFKKLIASWESNGYDNASEITVDQDLKLIDGSHRLALSLYHNINNINCTIYQRKTNYFYGTKWFETNGFFADEIETILKKEKEIKEKLLKMH